MNEYFTNTYIILYIYGFKLKGTSLKLHIIEFLYLIVSIMYFDFPQNITFI